LPDEKTMEWLRRQFLDPQTVYKLDEWATMAGLPTHRVRRWFKKRKIIKSGDGGHHEVTRDEIQQHWPAFWRSIRRRLTDLFAAGEVDDAA
jgi:hypothetical protein